MKFMIISNRKILLVSKVILKYFSVIRINSWLIDTTYDDFSNWIFTRIYGALLCIRGLWYELFNVVFYSNWQMSRSPCPPAQWSTRRPWLMASVHPDWKAFWTPVKWSFTWTTSGTALVSKSKHGHFYIIGVKNLYRPRDDVVYDIVSRAI